MYQVVLRVFPLAYGRTIFKSNRTAPFGLMCFLEEMVDTTQYL